MKKKNYENSIVKITAVICIVPIILIAFFFYIQYSEYKEVNTQFDDIYSSYDTELSGFIKSIVNENSNWAEDSIIEKSKRITQDILLEYKDNTSVLQRDIIYPDNDTDLTGILDKHLSSSFLSEYQNNYCFVLVKGKVIYDPSNNYDFEKGDTRTIDSLISKHPNQDLASTAINSLIDANKSQDEIIFWENTTSILDKHTLSSKMDFNEVIELYKENGISIFKNIDILVPAYITDDGDIFGVKDVDALGFKQDNFKMIIICRTNLYNIMSRYETELLAYDTKLNGSIHYLENLEKNRIIITIWLAILLIAGFTTLSIIQNKFISTIDEKSHNSKVGDVDDV